MIVIEIEHRQHGQIRPYGDSHYSADIRMFSDNGTDRKEISFTKERALELFRVMVHGFIPDGQPREWWEPRLHKVESLDDPPRADFSHGWHIDVMEEYHD